MRYMTGQLYFLGGGFVVNMRRHKVYQNLDFLEAASVFIKEFAEEVEQERQEYLNHCSEEKSK